MTLNCIDTQNQPVHKESFRDSVEMKIKKKKKKVRLVPTLISNPLVRLRLASPRRMDQLANRKRTKQLSPPPLFLCFSLCLSPFFYLIILDLKKKGACLSQSQGQVGARLVLGSGRHPLRDPIGPPSRAPGPHWASADPLGLGRTPSVPAESRAGVPGASKQRSRGSSCSALLLPGRTSPGSGPRVHWPGAQRGVAPHSALPSGHAPSSRSILAVGAQQLEELDVSPGKRLVPGP